MDKILFIAQRIPYPPNKGCKIRSFNEIKFLANKYKIDIVTFIDDKNDIKYINALKQYCNHLFTCNINKIISLIKGLFFLLIGKSLSEGYFHSTKIKKIVSNLINKNDYKFVLCFSSQMAQFVINKNIYKIMDFCDVDSDKFLQYSKKTKFPINLLYKLESKRLSKYENLIHQKFHKSIFITSKEVEIFLKNRTLNNIHIMGNGINFDFFKPKSVDKDNSLVFTGDMGYHANVDGVVWFCKKIFPEILKKVPDLKFYIVGRNPTKTVQNLKNENVIVTGSVPDTRPYISKAKMAIIPLRIARGVQNKVLEAMSMAIPVVISENLYSSLENISRDEIYVYDSKTTLINIILNSINNHELLYQRGQKHRQYVVNNLNWNFIFENSSVWNDLL